MLRRCAPRDQTGAATGSTCERDANRTESLKGKEKAARGRPFLESGTDYLAAEADEAAAMADEAAASADEAAEAAESAAEAAGEAIGAGAGGVTVVSSFLLQAARATAANREANRSDFFIFVLKSK